jgi:PAS domain S-box-containing protein
MQATAIPAPSRVSGRPLLTPGATATRLALFAAITLLPAIGALAVEGALWSFLRPFAWFAFFPAVFVSAWLGGWRAGVGAGLFSAGLVAWFFVPPEQPAVGVFLPAAVLVGTGVFVGALRARLRSSSARVAEALDRARSASAELVSFIELAPDGIFVADRDGRYTQVNEAGRRMLGYSRAEDLIGKSIVDLIPPEDRERLGRSKEHLLEGCIHVAEWSLRRKDGTYLPVEVSARILPDGRWQGLVRDTRERRRMELALHRNEDDLRRAQAVAQVGSWRLDVRRNELVWSDEAYRIFGITRGAPLTYETFLGCTHPDDRAEVDRRWKAAIAGEPYDVEHRVVADGVVKWVRERADLERDEHGEVLGGIGTTQDITEHKRIEDALRRAHETELRLRAELEAVSQADAAVADAVAALSGPNLATVLNMIALQARALTGAEFVALGVGTDPAVPFSPWVSLGVDPDTTASMGRGPRPVGTLGLVSRDGQTVRVADVHRHPAFQGFPAGHPAMASLLGVPIRYRGRAVGNLYLANSPGGPAFSEEDERRIQLLAARTGVAIETATLYAGEAGRRAWLQTVIEQMPEAVVMVDPQGGLLLHNQAAGALFPARASVGDPFAHELQDPSGTQVPDERRPLRRALAEGVTVVRAEHLVVGPGGERIPVLISATPIRVGERVTGAVAVFQDIRDQKELERLKEEWTSIVAHDLRQPLGTIRLSADRLLASRAERLTEQERALLTRVQECSTLLSRMIDDLLDASRIEADRMSIAPRSTDLRAVVGRTVEQLEDVLRGRRVPVVTAGDVSAWVDPDRLQQVLANLLSNAAKYGAPGTDIRVDLVGRDDEVEVTLTNEGPGIRPEELPLLFTRFARTREARAGRTPGLGLGLYISRGLVSAHGGRLWAESVPGRTTTFHVVLPRRAPP